MDDSNERLNQWIKELSANWKKELAKAIDDVDVVCLSLKHLPLLPSHRTTKIMAKETVVVYEGVITDRQ